MGMCCLDWDKFSGSNPSIFIRIVESEWHRDKVKLLTRPSQTFGGRMAPRDWFKLEQHCWHESTDLRLGFQGVSLLSNKLPIISMNTTMISNTTSIVWARVPVPCRPCLVKQGTTLPTIPDLVVTMNVVLVRGLIVFACWSAGFDHRGSTVCFECVVKSTLGKLYMILLGVCIQLIHLYFSVSSFSWTMEED